MRNVLYLSLQRGDYMILTLEEAKKALGIPIDDVSRDDEILDELKGIEVMIRNKTNNKFQNIRIRKEGNMTIKDSIITGADFYGAGFRDGNTVEIGKSLLNDGLYVIKDVDNISITLDSELYDETGHIMLTRIEYPADIKTGVKKLLKYNEKMSDKIGVKSLKLSRYWVEYYDMGTDESVEGYPAALLKFLDKYKKLRWS